VDGKPAALGWAWRCRGLADLDEVAVGVADVGADLAAVVFGLGQELRAPGRPFRTDPAQLTLFTMRRDWRPVLGAASLPALTGAAQQLLDDFCRAQPVPGDEAAGRPVRALRILAAWLGADARSTRPTSAPWPACGAACRSGAC